jgi:energy-coupling factor transport system permease protein
VRTGTSSYIPRDSFVHQLHPMTKMVLVLVASYAALIFPGYAVQLALFALAIVVAVGAKVWKQLVSFVVKYMGVILLTLFLVHGLFNPSNETPVFSIGPVVFYKEGLLFALNIAGRLLVIMPAFFLLTVTTHPGKMVFALVEAGLPARGGYLVLATLQTVPYMSGKISVIREAQKSRGLEVEGNILVRVSALIPLFVPLVMGSLVGIQERAMTLETRALGATEEITHYLELADSPGEKRLRKLMIPATVGLTAVAVVCRVTGVLS